jgi:hypothetical protein
MYDDRPTTAGRRARPAFKGPITLVVAELA